MSRIGSYHFHFVLAGWSSMSLVKATMKETASLTTIFIISVSIWVAVLAALYVPVARLSPFKMPKIQQ